MSAATPRPPKGLPEAARRRIEVAAAMAWEALIGTHTAQALHFITLLSDRLPFDEAVDRYLSEMGASSTLATAVRTRVLVALEDAERIDPERPSLLLQIDDDEEPDEPGGWRRFRPDVVMRGVRERVQRSSETERWIQLAVARAEEAVISAHVDNAITFVALLEDHMALERAVDEYVDSMKVLGGRAQAVTQRTMARLAEIHLPGPSDSATLPIDDARPRGA